jgi:hypothetical protein
MENKITNIEECVFYGVVDGVELYKSKNNNRLYKKGLFGLSFVGYCNGI